jgi:hypothetical protein
MNKYSVSVLIKKKKRGAAKDTKRQQKLQREN